MICPVAVQVVERSFSIEVSKESQGKLEMVVKAPRSIYSLPPVTIGSTPWLVLSHGRHKQIQTFYNPLDGSIHHRSIPEMRRKYCFGCSNGHLLMLDPGSRECYLLSLSTSMETFSLPKLQPLIQLPDFSWYERMFVMSSPSPSPNHVDCTVVLIKNFINEEAHNMGWEQDIMICKPCRKEEKEWMILRRIQQNIFGVITSGIADSDGKVYLHSYRNKLMLIDTRGSLDIDVQEIDDVEEIEKKGGPDHNTQLLIRSPPGTHGAGDLLVVIVNPTTYGKFHSAEVYRLNNSQSAWERLESINGQALFLGDIGPAYFVNDRQSKMTASISRDPLIMAWLGIDLQWTNLISSCTNYFVPIYSKFLSGLHTWQWLLHN